MSLSVVAVAIVTHDGLVFTMPRPARHHHVAQAMVEWGIDVMRESVEQGFLLSNGQFCRRNPAKLIAREAGQLLPRDSQLSELFSEDVW